MRHILAILLLSVLLKSEGFSQSDTTTVLKDSVRTVVIVPAQLVARSYQVMATAGISPMPYKELNDVLEKSNYVNVAEFAPGWLGGSPALNIELQAIIGQPDEIQGSLMVNFGYVTSGASGVDSAKGARLAIRLKKFSSDFGGSFRLVKNSWIVLYPFYLISPEWNKLTVEEYDYDRVTGHSENFIDKFNTTKLTNSLTTSSFSVGAGIGADVPLFSHNYVANTQITWLLGVRAGYQFGLFSFPWDSGNNSLMNAPDISARGFRVSAGLGWSMGNKVYKAKIISEEK